MLISCAAIFLSNIEMIVPSYLAFGAPSSLQSVQPIQHAFDTFWRADQVQEHLRNLQETIQLLNSVYVFMVPHMIIKQN